MTTRWMTLDEIAAERHISIADAQKFVDDADCPKLFKLRGTVYLV